MLLALADYSCGACRLSKIHRPSDCVQTAKDSVTSRGMNEKKHKTVFGDFKGSVFMNEEK